MWKNCLTLLYMLCILRMKATWRGMHKKSCDIIGFMACWFRFGLFFFWESQVMRVGESFPLFLLMFEDGGFSDIPFYCICMYVSASLFLIKKCTVKFAYNSKFYKNNCGVRVRCKDQNFFKRWILWNLYQVVIWRVCCIFYSLVDFESESAWTDFFSGFYSSSSSFEDESVLLQQ